MINLHHASCLDWLADYDGPLFDACVTDPPYEIGFMGKKWDNTGVAFRPETWRAVYDALKPGAHLVAFSSTRTYHRMACAIEDAGFEIRDQLMWTYGSGFPKSHDVSKGIDRAAGAVREVVGSKLGQPGYHLSGHDGGETFGFGLSSSTSETRLNSSQITASATIEAAAWEGWGTALKPALEPICLARKPLSEKSIAANVLKHGTGALNIDACRVNAGGQKLGGGMVSKGRPKASEGWDRPWMHDAEITERKKGESADKVAKAENLGRWPANLLHDCSDEVLAGFPDTGAGTERKGHPGGSTFGGGKMADGVEGQWFGDSGSAARFFYSAKAGPLDRIGTAHATVKPVDVMRWLCRLVTPPGGHILEPFAGSGTTGIAAMAEGFDCTMIELEADHVTDIERKLAFLRGEGAHTITEHNHAKRLRTAETPLGGLFGEAA